MGPSAWSVLASCCPSEGVPAAGCEPGVLMAILVALWSRKVLSLFLGTSGWATTSGSASSLGSFALGLTFWGTSTFRSLSR